MESIILDTQIKDEVLLFHTDCSTVHHMADMGAVHLSWYGKVSEEAFKDTFRFLLTYMAEHNISKLLMDERDLTALSTQGRMWLISQYAKGGGKSGITGLKKVAILHSQSGAGKTLTRLMHMSLQALGRYANIAFNTPREAESWLRW